MPQAGKYRIMGIDPGTNYTGYGVLEVEGRRLRSVVLGAIDLPRAVADPQHVARGRPLAPACVAAGQGERMDASQRQTR